MDNTLRGQARVDALQSAKAHLVEEQNALALCERNGWTNDARTAQREVGHFAALVARLERHPEL